MRDPWQDDVLDELVAYLQAAREARATAWAVVVTSSEALAEEVLGALEGRVGGLERVDVASGADPRQVVDQHLGRPHGDGFATTVFRGLPEVLASEQAEEFLAWLNFHREDFERPAEAFLFLMLAKDADKWNRRAADLDRYTQHFEFIDWDSFVAKSEDGARDAAATLELVDGRKLLASVEDRLERSRKSSTDVVVTNLLAVGLVALNMGQFPRAQTVVEEALQLTLGRNDELRRSVVRAEAQVLSHLGQPIESLRRLEEVVGNNPEDPDARVGLAVERFFAGQPLRALSEIERLLAQRSRTSSNFSDDPSRISISLSNATAIQQWLGQHTAAAQLISKAPLDLPPLSRHQVGWSWESKGSFLVDTGDIIEALDPLTWALAVARTHGSAYLEVAVRVNGSRATLDAGHPARSLRLLEGAATSLGWKTARSHGLAAVRAEASWTLSGPSAVLPVVRDERERQKGWQAPIPAAELAYVRALASVHDDEARRCLQEAADRFRAMDGWYYLSELERRLARLDRLRGDLDRADARIREGLAWHAREGLRPREARDRTERAMIALGRGEPEAALESASQALELIHACRTRLYEPAALVALAAAEHALGHHEAASAHDQRWRRLVQGIDAKGLEEALERDAAWARGVMAR